MNVENVSLAALVLLWAAVIAWGYRNWFINLRRSLRASESRQALGLNGAFSRIVAISIRMDWTGIVGCTAMTALLVVTFLPSETWFRQALLRLALIVMGVGWAWMAHEKRHGEDQAYQLIDKGIAEQANT